MIFGKSVPTYPDFSRHQIAMCCTLVVLYIMLRIGFSWFIPELAGVYPAMVLGLVFIYLAGMRLWPCLLITTIAAELFIAPTFTHLVMMSAVFCIQAILGAHLIHRFNIDSVFRRKHDVYGLLQAAALTALISPIGVTLISLNTHVSLSWFTIAQSAIGSFLTIIVIAPFLLRWMVKPRFQRTHKELLELGVVFTALIGLSILAQTGMTTPLVDTLLSYAVLIPLFWISLRMRPRFVTLAIMIVAGFSLYEVILSSPLWTTMSILQAEIQLAAITIIFLIITSQEEDRRTNRNLVQSQMLTLENALVRINSESRAKEDFISVLAHELRNPLAPIVSTIEYLKLDASRNDSEKEAFELVESRLATIKRLLDDLLDVSRLTEGKLPLESQEMDLIAALKSSLVSTDHYREERHQNLKMHLPKKPVWITGDRVRIEQVFTNLLANASKYSPAGSTIRLDVSLSHTPGSVTVSVSDAGVGLSKESLERIFLPFHQIHSEKKKSGGLGLGLALVKNFVELHDGTVYATSKGLGKGSTFVVTFPCTDAPAQAQLIVDDTSEHIHAPSKEKPKTSVLIVDDNDAAASALGRLLEALQYRVWYAYDGFQALEAVRRHNPDAILLDINLPDKSGYEVAQELKEDGYSNPIIALSGYGEKYSAETYGDQKVFEQYLVKPVGVTELRKVLPEP